MAMSNGRVAEFFAKGERFGKSANMTIAGDDLFSYGTVVAKRLDGDRVAINPKKYSVSTSGQVSKVRYALAKAGYRETTETVQAPVSGGRYWQSDEPFIVWER